MGVDASLRTLGMSEDLVQMVFEGLGSGREEWEVGKAEAEGLREAEVAARLRCPLPKVSKSDRCSLADCCDSNLCNLNFNASVSNKSS